MTTKATQVRETRKAELISINGREVWVPKSAIVSCNRDLDRRDDYGSGEWDYTIADWKAREIGLSAEAAYDNLHNEGAEGYNPHR